MQVDLIKKKAGGFTVLVIRGAVFLGAPLLTIWLVNSLANMADGFVGPFVRFVADLFLSDESMKSEIMIAVFPYLSLIVAIFVAAFFGVVASFHYGKKGLRLIDALILWIPGVNSIYRTVRSVLDMIGGQDGGPAKFSRTVWLDTVGHEELGFVSNEKEVDGVRYLTVFVPIQAPNPLGGRIYRDVPEAETEPSGMTMEESIQFVISLGAAQKKEPVSAAE